MRRASLVQCGAAVAVAATSLAVLPAVLPIYVLMNLTSFIGTAIFALSLALVWGFGGIASYGQAAFFGLGCYTYAIAAINLGDTTLAVPLAILVPVLFSAVLGYFVFYGRLSSIYVSVVTLAASLILFKLINSTAGHGYRIGKAALGGFNGISDTPGLNLPFDPDAALTPEQLFAVALIALLLCYLGCKWLLETRFGRALIAVRENEVRAELLGYNVRALRLGSFMIGAGIAGLSGILFANSVYVSPTVFGLSTMAQSLIWVVIGGLGSLMGAVVSCIALSWLTGELGSNALLDPNIVLGLLLVLFVRFVPSGIVPALERILSPLTGWPGRSKPSTPTGTASRSALSEARR